MFKKVLCLSAEIYPDVNLHQLPEWVSFIIQDEQHNARLNELLFQPTAAFFWETPDQTSSSCSLALTYTDPKMSIT